MTSVIEVHVAALRAAPLQDGDALQLARYMVDPDNVHKPDIARTLGYSAYDVEPAERLELAAAALIIAAEYERLSPFEQWFMRNHTKEERERFNDRDKQMMEIGFTNYGRRQ